MGDVIDLGVPGRAEGNAQLVIVPKGLDVAIPGFPPGELGINVAVMNHAPAAMVDDHADTQIRAVRDHQGDLVPLPERLALIDQEVRQAGGGGHAAPFVHEQEHQDLLPHFGQPPLLMFHFLPRHEQILGQAPVQVGPGPVHGRDLQVGHFTPLGQGRLEAGHQATFVLPVGKDLQNLAGFEARGRSGKGQQNRPIRAPVQEYPFRRQAQDLQVIQGAEGGHHAVRSRGG